MNNHLSSCGSGLIPAGFARWMLVWMSAMAAWRRARGRRQAGEIRRRERRLAWASAGILDVGRGAARRAA